MVAETVAIALEQEHREIDGGIEEYLAGAAADGHPTSSLSRAMAALRRHIYLEEEFLFPPLREAGLMMPIFVMLREHGELWRSLDELEGMLATGTGAAFDTDAVSSACHELLAKLDKHNAKEEPILYAQADAALSAEASGTLSRFLASGRMPDGWVCHGAQG